MWIYIVGVFLLGLILLFLSPIVIGIRYDDDLCIWVRLWFFKFKVYPQPKKKKKVNKQATKKQTKHKQKQQPQKPSAVKTMFQKHGIAGTIQLVAHSISVLSSSCLRLFKGARVRGLAVTLGITGEDAAEAAIGYGRVCSVFYPVLGTMAQHMKVIKPTVNVYCDYQSAQPTVRAEGKIYISVYHAVSTALLALYKLGFKK